MVDYFRLGRVGLYYLSIDQQQAAIWDNSEKKWNDLEDIEELKNAIKIANDTAPPGLINLPLSFAKTMENK